ncbi:MAG: hypothetical protein HZA60_03945, partial [Deltaproteobacteria bacterium]|nr:hypothetical protein [Deltaproteobacteria bacterium]
MKKAAVILAACCALSMTSGVAAFAKPLLVDEFGGILPDEVRSLTGGQVHPEGKGKAWKAVSPGDHIRYALPADNGALKEGTIELAVKAGESAGKASEAVCVFEAPSKKGLLSLYFIRRFNVTGKEESVLWVEANPEGASPVGDYVSLGRLVPPGETIHLAILWNRATPSVSGFYAGGRKLSAYSYRKSPLKPVPEAATDSVAGMISSAASFRVGSDDRGTHLLASSSVTRVAIHDKSLSPSEMDGAISTIKSVTDDSFKVAGISGKLVGGDKVNVELVAGAGGKSSFDMGIVKGIPLS